MFGNWTFGTLVFTVMVITVTLKVRSAMQLFLRNTRIFKHFIMSQLSDDLTGYH